MHAVHAQAEEWEIKKLLEKYGDVERIDMKVGLCLCVLVRLRVGMCMLVGVVCVCLCIQVSECVCVRAFVRAWEVASLVGACERV